MKKIIYLMAFSLLCTFAQAQSYSNWITDSNHPNLKVRYTTSKDVNGYSYIRLELQSTLNCKFNVTASLCNVGGSRKNGWQPVILLKNKSVFKSFKILNYCTDGFWWWYNEYKSTAVKFD